MATSNSQQTIIDTTKRTIIKRVGIFDATGGDETQTVIIDPRYLSGTLDANGRQWTIANTLPSGFGANCVTIKRVVYNVDAEVGHLQLKWQGTGTGNDKTILALGVGAGDTNPNDNLPAIWNNATAPTGNITIQTVGTTANAAYTLIIELHKDNRYFQAGQFNDPAAFNYPPYGLTP
ncbi:hypothetical protein EBR43_13105 [bacterium]|nr:hypothetical protein [bacterium]